MSRAVTVGIGAVGFCVLAIMNTGGYRYGVSDQAFYIPVVLHELTPELYPHDAGLIAAQDRFFMFDDWFAPILRFTGVSLPVAFWIAYLVTLVLYYGALVGLGQTVYASAWTSAALVVALTMRHRIPDTAVNSLEGYFHPRVLAFAVGLWAVVALLRGRTWLSLALTGMALLVHPTTGLWFVVAIGVAGVVGDPLRRRPLVVFGVLVTAGGAWVLTGPLEGHLAVMDPTWTALVSVKDYLDPARWPPLTWIANLSMAAMIAGVYAIRRARGLVSSRETGLVAGCATLLAGFLLTVPLASAHVALAVQLQLNRVFWLLDIIGSCYLGWLLVEAAWWSREPRANGVTPRRVVVAIVCVVAVTRGAYVMLVEQAGQPMMRVDLAEGDWRDVMEWVERQPVGTHLLAHPDHAVRYGSSVRAASGRDVYLEVIKDTGIAIYSAAVAHRVSRRLADLGDFDGLPEDHARRLARRYRLDYLITERPMQLPVVLIRGRFRVYDLADYNAVTAENRAIVPTSAPKLETVGRPIPR